MSSGFAWGLIVGLAISVLLAAGAVAYSYRRFVRLERRARRAERLAELGTLTGGLAHEIKNPLSTVQLNLQLLQEDLDPQHPSYDRLLKRLTTVRNEASRLRDILGDFLRYAGRVELDRKPVELNNLVEELADFVMPQAQLQKVRLRLNKSPQPVTAPVDSRLIKQAILNLVLNGLQAMNPRGGEMILSVAQRDGAATIDVIDTGPGIPPEALSRIFEAYYSTRKGGTGLGLPMARRIAEEHGGTLSVTSEPGKGTDFTLRLPLRAR